MRVRINLESDPISLVVLAANGYEHDKLESLGNEAIVEVVLAAIGNDGLDKNASNRVEV